VDLGRLPRRPVHQPGRKRVSRSQYHPTAVEKLVIRENMHAVQMSVKPNPSLTVTVIPTLAETDYNDRIWMERPNVPSAADSTSRAGIFTQYV
jgi:hypothetical protein